MRWTRSWSARGATASGTSCARPAGGAGAGAGGLMRGRAALALVRIVDVHEYMLALEGDAEANGAFVALGSPWSRRCGARRRDPHRRRGRRAGAPGRRGRGQRGGTRRAGRRAEHRRAGSRPRPPLHYAKGNYFYLTGQVALLASGLSDAFGRMARSARRARPRRPLPLRPGPALGRYPGLRRGGRTEWEFLRIDPPLLSGAAGRLIVARLHRHPPQAPRSRRSGARPSSSRARRRTASTGW